MLLKAGMKFVNHISISHSLPKSFILCPFKIYRLCIRKVVILVSILTLMPCMGFAQPKEAVALDSSQAQNSKVHNDLWLTAAFSWDPIMIPQPGNPEELGGYSYTFGGSWDHQVLILSAHSARGFFERDPLEEHLYDYSLLYGLSSRKATYSFGEYGSFFDIAIGLSYIDYIT